MARHYGLDWLRIGAFALLILYHIGMYFVPWPWHVKIAPTLDWVSIPMFATNSWRLLLLFVVSGYATRALVRKSEFLSGLARERTTRLLIPLLFGMIVIVPPQPWIELVTQHGLAKSFPDFWLNDYFDFKTMSGLDVPTWNHLWFVAYLWVYSLLLLAVLGLTGRHHPSLQASFDRAMAGPGLLLAPLAWLLLVRVVLFFGEQETHGLLDDVVGHLTFLPAFLFGFALGGSETALRAAVTWRKAAALLFVAAYAVVIGIDLRWPGNNPIPPNYYAIFDGARRVQGWAAIVALLGIAERHWNRDHPLRAKLTEAVFPFYIIHQTIIVVLGWLMLPLALPPLASFVILVAATAGGCWLFYELGRRITWFRPLIGLKASAGASRAEVALPRPVP